MPRPTDQQITYMALCVITELDEVGRRAAEAGREAVTLRDSLGDILRQGQTLTPDALAEFTQRAVKVGNQIRELEENVRNLTHSKFALELASRSLS